MSFTQQIFIIHLKARGIVMSWDLYRKDIIRFQGFRNILPICPSWREITQTGKQLNLERNQDKELKDGDVIAKKGCRLDTVGNPRKTGNVPRKGFEECALPPRSTPASFPTLLLPPQACISQTAARSNGQQQLDPGEPPAPLPKASFSRTSHWASAVQPRFISPPCLSSVPSSILGPSFFTVPSFHKHPQKKRGGIAKERLHILPCKHDWT